MEAPKKKWGDEVEEEEKKKPINPNAVRFVPSFSGGVDQLSSMLKSSEIEDGMKNIYNQNPSTFPFFTSFFAF